MLASDGREDRKQSGHTHAHTHPLAKLAHQAQAANVPLYQRRRSRGRRSLGRRHCCRPGSGAPAAPSPCYLGRTQRTGQSAGPRQSHKSWNWTFQVKLEQLVKAEMVITQSESRSCDCDQHAGDDQPSVPEDKLQGRPPTVVFEVPHAQGFIGGGRDQHQAAVRGEGQIPDDVGVIHQIQQQRSCRSDAGLAASS